MECSNCGFETLEKINFCPVCATQINQSTSEVNQASEVNLTPEVNQASDENKTNEINQSTNDSPTYSQIQADNYIFGIKDWFVGNLVLLVISALLWVSVCCINIFALASLIISIIGVVYSNKVKKNIIEQKYDQAIRDSKTAKTLFYISLGIMIFSLLVVIATIVFLVGIRFFSSNNYSNSY